MNWITVGLLFFLVAAPASFGAMTIEEAYRAIPHERTVFDPARATMPEGEKIYLQKFLSLVEAATVERVDRMNWIKNGQQTRRDPNSEKIATQIEQLSAPDELKGVSSLVVAAIREQGEVLSRLERGPAQAHFSFPKGAPGVETSSQKLRKAYDELIALYPKESLGIQKAFFDTLCALDFI